MIRIYTDTHLQLHSFSHFIFMFLFFFPTVVRQGRPCRSGGRVSHSQGHRDWKQDRREVEGVERGGEGQVHR